MTHSRIVGILVLLSALNLALMVPGGFVETRVFPHYSVSVLAAFNVFLTILGLGSFILAYAALRYGRTGMWPVVAGVAYVAVYVADLLHIFPVSQNPMSTVLTTLESVGTVLGVMLIVASIRSVSASQGDRGGVPSGLSRGLLFVLSAVGIGIVIFATLSAM
ncbi:hypothetical protein SAMN04515647_3936 [Cohaesibacter sp. ES.047]|uniref:hypothetical protein n=1 Tax=Cohaesibacter sp. ES.047 TaxID=1798205 RepID=UPI000BB971CD|nr:hypothetical protein [Cohaesibacter sp. ES.047]SNY93625.1 hypothetical protein SAMN04515647_3936 [Cohaesibacter sp. ES.047]